MKEDVPMNRTLQVAIAFAALVLTAGVVHAQTPATAKLNHAQLKRMNRTAHTAEQYQALADYYESREEDFKQQAKTEKLEWDRLGRNVPAFSFAKYPRPVDASRNYYYYLRYKAQQMSEKAAHYDDLSASATQ